MPSLPTQPNLDQLRRRAKDLLRAARAGDREALRRLGAVSDEVTLTSAQLALAREHGFAGWPKLKAEVEARTLALAGQADALCRAVIGGQTERAAEMLASTPELAGYNLFTAVVLGDAVRVGEELRRNPGAATRRDPASGWLPMHAACSSRWHHREPVRAEGLLAVVELLLEAGASPIEESSGRRRWRPLRCVIAVANSGPSNRGVAELLLERGSVPDDHDLYLAGFAHDRRALLPLLLAHVPDVEAIAEQALAASISQRDTESVRLLLEAGADPRRYRNDEGEPMPVVRAARRAGCDREIVELLVRHGAESAGDDDPLALVGAARVGDAAEVERLLDLGFPIDARADDGGTALHAASYAGSAPTVRLLLERGADLEARDTSWNSTPLGWAMVGSGERPSGDPSADWVETVRTLLDAGASTADVTLSPDDPKPPSPEVAELLRGT